MSLAHRALLLQVLLVPQSAPGLPLSSRGFTCCRQPCLKHWEERPSWAAQKLYSKLCSKVTVRHPSIQHIHTVYTTLTSDTLVTTTPPGQGTHHQGLRLVFM